MASPVLLHGVTGDIRMSSGGTGMSCYELKGGIGSASRGIRFGDKTYSIGVLVLTNMGKKGELIT